MTISVHYGNEKIRLSIPNRNLAHFFQPWQEELNGNNEAAVRSIVDCREFRKFEKDVVGKSVCLLLPDETRAIALEDIFEGMYTALAKAKFVLFMICTGTHDADTPGNKAIEQLIIKWTERAGIVDYKIDINNCRIDNYINAGKTSSGTDIFYNEKIEQADIFISLNDVKVHYFAGYSNPVKNFVPGICNYKTAEQNHKFAFDPAAVFGRHPWHKDRSRRNNPVAADQVEGLTMIAKERPVYAFLTVTTSGLIQWVKFGPIGKVTPDAFEMVDKHNVHAIEPTQYLIVTPGGLPNDIDLYISQRALELNQEAVMDGGEILFLSQCPGGIGQEHTLENFYNRLTDDIDQIIQKRDSDYKLFSHKPYRFAQLLKRVRKIWIYSQIPPQQSKDIHLTPITDPQEVINRWLAEKPDAKITVIDGGNKLAVISSAHSVQLNTIENQL